MVCVIDSSFTASLFMPDEANAKSDALGKRIAADGGKGYERDDVPLRITCALAVIPADCGRETWWRVGAGIYSAMGEEGFLIFDDWSSSAAGNTPDGEPVYTPEGTRRMWRECARMSAITVATVYGIADEHDRSWREFYDNEMRARRAGR